MFIDHFAAGFAARRIAPRGSPALTAGAIMGRQRTRAEAKMRGAVAGFLLGLASAGYGQAPEPSPYAYASGDRRDPFADPRTMGNAGVSTRCRCGGPSGFLIQELALRGIIRTPKGYAAMVEGPDRKSYVTRVGEKLFDGTIAAVDGEGVTVRQEVTDPLARVKTREVRIVLHAAEGH
jgi:Tfp pilus assembly protein PilP